MAIIRVDFEGFKSFWTLACPGRDFYALKVAKTIRKWFRELRTFIPSRSDKELDSLVTGEEGKNRTVILTWFSIYT